MVPSTWLTKSSSVLVGPTEGARTCPGATSKLAISVCGPCRIYSKFDALHQAWLHRACGMRAFMGLNASLLIGAHDMHTLCVSLGCLLIQLADDLDVWVKLLGVVGAVVIEPIA